MTTNENKGGKILPLVLVILILMIAAAAAGYYLSWSRFERNQQELTAAFEAFEGRYESRISSMGADLMDMKAAVEAGFGDNQAETNRLKRVGILLKAKSEIISGKLSLSRDDLNASLGHLDSAIAVLMEASDLVADEAKIEIDELRLQLATVKGLLDSNPGRAEEELDKIWRGLDALIEG